MMLTNDGPRLFGAWWAAGDDPCAPRLSPLYADLTGLPRTFRDKVVDAGGTLRHTEYPGGFHMFRDVTFLPEFERPFKGLRTIPLDR